jgi:hypothetical protein
MELEKATVKVYKTKNKQVFIDYLQAFMDEEETHIRKFLNTEEFNLRAAALCAEAYAAAQLMKSQIEHEKQNAPTE